MSRVVTISFLLFNFIGSFAQKPIIQLPFDGDYTNATINSLICTEHGHITYSTDRFGIPCKAAHFDGNSYITIDDNKLFDNVVTSFSVTVWFKFGRVNNLGRWLTILCKGNNKTETKSNPHFRAQIFQNNLQSTVSISTDFTEYDKNYLQHEFKSDEWMFYALVYDGDSVSVYLNANKIWSFPYNKVLRTNKSQLFIGRDIPGADEYYIGDFDDLRFYSYAISLKKIKTIYSEINTNSIVDNVLECPDNIKQTSDFNKCGSIINYVTPKNYGCEKDSIVLLRGFKSGTEFPVGRTTIAYKTIRGKNSSICKFNVEIYDNQKPIVECPHDTTIKVENKYWSFVEQKPFIYDNCKIDTIYRIDNNRNIEKLYPGLYNIKYYVTDIYGNFSTCEYKIHILKNDSVRVKKDTVPINDVIVFKDKYNFESRNITIAIYDNKKQDGDRITVYFNNNKIINNATVKNKRRMNKIIIKSLVLVPNIKNSLVIQALNMGSVGKNTVQLDFFEGTDVNVYKDKPKYSKVYNSEPGFASAILLNLIK